MRTMYATMALALVSAGAATFASPLLALETYAEEQPGDIYASNLIGRDIYRAENDWDALNNDDEVGADAAKNWEDIGEVNDVILSRDGNVKAVILGVGGFLGIGEKDVAVPMSQIKIVREKDDRDDTFLVVKTNKESLNALPSYREKTDRKSKSERRADGNGNRMANKQDRAGSSGETAEQDGTKFVAITTIKPAMLKGARLYSVKNEDIGEVDQVLTKSDGNIDVLILDVGGFLGLGEHRISANPSELKVKTDRDGKTVWVYIDATKEQLEKRPAYKG